jgi:Zn-dependent protease
MQAPLKIRKIPTSEKEIQDLIKSWAAISLAFAILFTGGLSLDFSFLSAFLLSGLTVGIGFVFHELAHKLVAQHYGCIAEYRADNKMLLLAIILSFVGFIFAAPGAVLISGPVGKRRNGVISAAGPATNFCISLIFLLLLLFMGQNALFDYGYRINAFIGLFNMIPAGMFDGRKILAWNNRIFYSMAGFGLMLYILGFLVF